MKIRLFQLIHEDIQRYSSLKYLSDRNALIRLLSAFRHRGARTVIYFRISQESYSLPFVLRLLLLPFNLLLRLLLLPSNCCELPSEGNIAGGLYLAHPSGIIIAPQCRIGSRCSLFSSVVLGINHLDSSRRGPVLGDDVVVYSGAKIIGDVKVGHRAIIGANAVVIGDVDDDCIVAGVPAKCIGVRDSGAYLEF